MNSKTYINYFPEIASMDADEQEALLEKARYTAFTRLGLAGKSALYFIVSMLAGLCLPVLTYAFFGLSVLFNALALGVGIWLSSLLHKQLYASLIQQGLKKC